MHNFFKYYINFSYNNNIKYNLIKNDINELHDSLINIYNKKRIRLDVLLNSIINLCIKKNILLTDNCLNGMLLFLQLNSFFDNVKSLTSESTYEKFTKNVLMQAKTYNICHDLIEFLENKLIINNVKSEFHEIDNKFNILKDLCINNDIKKEN
jgi:hypothetical protein